MQFIVGKYRLYDIVKIGTLFMMAGLLVLFIFQNDIYFIVIGLFFYVFGIGLANGFISRLIITIEGFPHHILSTMYGFIQTLIFVLVISVVNILMDYFSFLLRSFSWSAFLVGLIGVFFATKYISTYCQRGWG